MLPMDKIRSFAKIGDAVDIPNLNEIQTRCYDEFLQVDIEPAKRKSQGLEALLEEVFPIISYDEQTTLEYQYYELDGPRYTVQDCRDLGPEPFRLTVSGLSAHFPHRIVPSAEPAISFPAGTFPAISTLYR